MMLEYPVKLEPDDNDTILVTSPDFPELTTFGETEDDALARAMDAFDEAIAARISGREDVPAPSRGRVRMRLRSLTAAKVLLYRAMRDEGVGRAELARRCNWHLQQVDRVLNVSHASRLDQIDAALNAVGKTLVLEVR